jgi:hypothetical protein
MRGAKNSLGALRAVEGVQSLHFEQKSGSAIVKFQDGTFMRISTRTSTGLRREALRLEVRAKVMRALASNMETGGSDD